MSEWIQLTCGMKGTPARLRRKAITAVHTYEPSKYAPDARSEVCVGHSVFIAAETPEQIMAALRDDDA